MKISAIVNCFNEEDFIYYSLGSIYKNVDEIVVVDNKSEDRTPEIIANFIAKNDNERKVKFFPLQSRMQLAAVRNFALSKSSNEWTIKWDGDFCAFDSNDELAQKCAAFSNLIDIVKQKSDIYDFFLLYSLNVCGDIYHYDSTRKYLGLSGDSFIGKRSCIKYDVNEKYGDVGILRRPDGTSPRMMYLNNPDVNDMYFLHFYGVKDDRYLLYRRFLSEYQVWIANNEMIDFWEWMSVVKNYDSSSGVSYVRKKMLENMIKHNINLPKIINPIIENPRYLIRYENEIVSDRISFF